MVSVSVSAGGSPAEVKQRFAEQMEAAKATNEGASVIEAAEAYVATTLDAIPADHEAKVVVHLFVQVEHSAGATGS